MRNPWWLRDEEILLLDVYLRVYPTSASDPAVLELSELLRRLPLHPRTLRAQSFRNPNGVLMKLRNLGHIDPEHQGRGLVRASSLSREVWHEFAGDLERLTRTTAAIRAAALSCDETEISALRVEHEETAVEGRLLYRMHCLRERKPHLVAAKKREALLRTGALVCEVCGFDFETEYGALGIGYMECHHVVPLAEAAHERSVCLSDLALVCANCHRMIHRGGTTRSLADLVDARRNTAVLATSGAFIDA
jgi:5-methylcytosine-specific restriction protein A